MHWCPIQPPQTSPTTGLYCLYEKEENSSFRSSLKPRGTATQSSQSSKPKINTVPKPSISHINGENKDANKPVSLQAFLLPKKRLSI